MWRPVWIGTRGRPLFATIAVVFIVAATVDAREHIHRERVPCSTIVAALASGKSTADVANELNVQPVVEPITLPPCEVIVPRQSGSGVVPEALVLPAMIELWRLTGLPLL